MSPCVGSPRAVFSAIVHVAAGVSALLLFMAASYSLVWVDTWMVLL